MDSVFLKMGILKAVIHDDGLGALHHGKTPAGGPVFGNHRR